MPIARAHTHHTNMNAHVREPLHGCIDNSLLLFLKHKVLKTALGALGCESRA